MWQDALQAACIVRYETVLIWAERYPNAWQDGRGCCRILPGLGQHAVVVRDPVVVVPQLALLDVLLDGIVVLRLR